MLNIYHRVIPSLTQWYHRRLNLCFITIASELLKHLRHIYNIIVFQPRHYITMTCLLSEQSISCGVMSCHSQLLPALSHRGLMKALWTSLNGNWPSPFCRRELAGWMWKQAMKHLFEWCFNVHQFVCVFFRPCHKQDGPFFCKAVLLQFTSNYKAWPCRRLQFLS